MVAPALIGALVFAVFHYFSSVRGRLPRGELPEVAVGAKALLQGPSLVDRLGFLLFTAVISFVIVGLADWSDHGAFLAPGQILGWALAEAVLLVATWRWELRHGARVLVEIAVPEADDEDDDRDPRLYRASPAYLAAASASARA